jgi:hypothetical protein
MESVCAHVVVGINTHYMLQIVLFKGRIACLTEPPGLHGQKDYGSTVLSRLL